MLIVLILIVGLTAAPAHDGKSRLGLEHEMRPRAGAVIVPRESTIDQDVPFSGTTPPQLYVSSSVELGGFAPGDDTIVPTLRDPLGNRATAADLPFSVTPATARATAAPPAPGALAPPGATPPVAPAPPAPVAALTRPTIARLGTDGLVAQGVRVRSGTGFFSAGRIELRGTALTEAEFARLLDPASNTPLWERFSGVTVKEIIVPELKGELETKGTHGAILTLRDVRLTDVARGRIGSLAIGGGLLSPTAPQGQPRVGFAKLDATDFDIALLLSLTAPATGPGDLRTGYRSFAIEGIEVRHQGSSDVSRIARIAGRDLRVRPTLEGWAATFKRARAAFAEEPVEERAPTGENVRALASLAELLDAVDPGSLDVTGLELTVPAGKPAGKPETVRAARFAFGPDRDGLREIRMDGFAYVSSEGPMRLASFSVEGIGLRGPIAGMRLVASSGVNEIGPTEVRRLVPQIRAIRLGGLDVDLTKPGPEPVRLAIDAIELATTNPVEGVPTSVRLALNNIVVPIASAKGMDPTGQLGQLGYSIVALSARTDLAWNEAQKQIVLGDLSVEGTDMGRVALRGVVANISKEVFSPDMPLAGAAAQGAAVQSIDLEIEDRGLVQRLLASYAKMKGDSIESVRADAGAYATLGLPGMLGDTTATKALGRAVAQFIAKPGRLTIGLKAKSAAGIGAADLADGSDPASFLAKVDLTAEAR